MSSRPEVVFNTLKMNCECECECRYMKAVDIKLSEAGQALAHAQSRVQV